MAGALTAGRAGRVGDVVGVEVPIHAVSVIADRLHLVDFPLALEIRPNIPYQGLRNLVWDQVRPRPHLAAGACFDHTEAAEASYRG